MQIVTGYTGEPHVTSNQDAIRNAIGMATSGRYVIPNLGNGLSAEIISNNVIRINDGSAINQGRLMCIAPNDYEDVEISTGIAGSKRADLIVIRYTKDTQTGIESANLVVIEGTAGAEYADPDYNDNDLLNDKSSIDDLVLYRVKINGLSIEEVERVADRWYLDTGWRNDVITVVGSETDFQPSIRVIGNQVFLDISVTSKKNRLLLHIDEEFLPKQDYKLLATYPRNYMNDDTIYVIMAEIVRDSGQDYNLRFRYSGDDSKETIDCIASCNWFLD